LDYKVSSQITSQKAQVRAPHSPLQTALMECNALPPSWLQGRGRHCVKDLAVAISHQSPFLVDVASMHTTYPWSKIGHFMPPVWRPPLPVTGGYQQL